MSRLALAVCLAATLIFAATAAAHVERPSYWPDPAPDTSISPATGGAVPKAKTLGSALRKGQRRRTKVVCQPGSMALLKASIRKARREGFDIRPSDHRSLS